MGVRLNFYKNNSVKSFKSLIIEHYSDLRLWYLERNKSSIEEYNEVYGNEQLISFFEETPEIDINFTNVNKEIVDELTAVFVGEYTSQSENGRDLLESFGHSVYKWRYEESTELISRSKNNELIRLWNFLIYGRSLKDNEEFNSYSNDYKIGFLTYPEQVRLIELMENTFGNVKMIMSKYRSGLENLNQANSKRNRFSLIDSLLQTYPLSEGLENVLTVLIQIKDDKNDIITTIDC